MNSYSRRSIAAATFLSACLFFSAGNDARADAADDPLLLAVFLDQLESRDIGGDNTFSWAAEGWLGKDLRKIWIKTEGERTAGVTDGAELQLLLSKAVARYWDIQVGVRHDFKPSPSQSWVAIGIKGLAPYFFDIDTAVYIGESGRTAFRFEAELEWLLTQRLILSPEIEINAYGQNDAVLGIGSGLSEIEAGIRLRYEIRRQFAPYVGVHWSKMFGNTADYASLAGMDTSATQLVIGLRAWF